jgi:hypothetical protein
MEVAGKSFRTSVKNLKGIELRLTVSPPVSNNKRRSKLENKREEG